MPKKAIVSASDILGNIKAPKPSASPVHTSLCVVCNKAIPANRIEALKSLGLPASKWAHTSCSTVTKVKGLYLGEAGTSTLQVCDKIYNDSVRSVFRSADTTDEDDES